MSCKELFFHNYDNYDIPINYQSCGDNVWHLNEIISSGETTILNIVDGTLSYVNPLGNNLKIINTTKRCITENESTLIWLFPFDPNGYQCDDIDDGLYGYMIFQTASDLSDACNRYISLYGCVLSGGTELMFPGIYTIKYDGSLEIGTEVNCGELSFNGYGLLYSEAFTGVTLSAITEYVLSGNVQIVRIQDSVVTEICDCSISGGTSCYTTPTPTATLTGQTPTPTPTTTLTGETPTPTPTETLFTGETPTPTPTQTNTGTPAVTPTQTATPTPTKRYYGYNIIDGQLTPFPPSGTTIWFDVLSASTENPNEIYRAYWNVIDKDGIDRAYSFTGLTGQSVYVYFVQNNDAAVYSAATGAFNLISELSGNTMELDSSKGNVALVVSADTIFDSGQTVDIRVSIIVDDVEGF